MTKATVIATTIAAAAALAGAAADSAATAAPAVVKAPSKKSQAIVIFNTKLAERAAGKFASNKEFRAAVLSTIEADLGVSTASAATMYNQCKQDLEALDPEAKLGRDPKKEKVVSATPGKRGRPAKVKADATAVVDAVAPAAELAIEVVPGNVVVIDEPVDHSLSIEVAA